MTSRISLKEAGKLFDPLRSTLRVVKRSKYGNKRTTHDGMKFDSVGEKLRWQELCQMQRDGAISDLKRQVKITLLESVTYEGAFKATGPMTYIADYQYVEHGKTVTEDFKSPATLADAGFVQKRHMLKALKGIDLRISMAGQTPAYGAPKKVRAA